MTIHFKSRIMAYMTFILLTFISFVVIFFFIHALKRANFDRKVRKSVRREAKKEARRNYVTKQEQEKMRESNFDEGFLAEAGIHPHSWIGRPRKIR